MSKRILRLPAVIAKTGLSRSTIYHQISLGKFPPPIRLTERNSGWQEQAIDQWIDEKNPK